MPTKYCTVTKTTKYTCWVLQTRVKQIEGGGRPPSWKNRKMAILPEWFDRLERNLARWRILALSAGFAGQISIFWKSKIADGRRLEKSKTAMSACTMVRPISTKFGMMTHGILGLRTGMEVTIFNFINPRWRTAAILKNCQMTISPEHFDRSKRNLTRWRILPLWSLAAVKMKYGRMTHIGPPNRRQVNFRSFKNPRWRTAVIFKNRKTALYLQCPLSTKFGMITHVSPPKRTGSYNFDLFKIQDGGRLPFWNSKIGHILATVWLERSARNLTRWQILASWKGKAGKLLNF